MAVIEKLESYISYALMKQFSATGKHRGILYLVMCFVNMFMFSWI